MISDSEGEGLAHGSYDEAALDARVRAARSSCDTRRRSPVGYTRGRDAPPIAYRHVSKAAHCVAYRRVARQEEGQQLHLTKFHDGIWRQWWKEVILVNIRHYRQRHRVTGMKMYHCARG